MTMSSTHIPTQPATPVPRKWRDAALLLGLFLLVIAGLIGLAAATGWEETKAQLAKLSLSQIGILLVLSLANYVFRGSRWHVLARTLGLPTTFGQNLRHFIGGFAMSVTPGRVGELIRMRWIKRETGWSVDRTMPMVLMDRASDLAAMALILAMGLAFGSGGVTFGLPVVLAALTAAFVATRPRLLAEIANIAYRIVGRFPRLFASLRRASRSLAAFTRIETLTLTLSLALIGWLAEGYAFYLLLVWMDADIGFWMAVTVFTFSTLAGGLTGAPGGVGGAEAAMVALLSLQGVPLEVSIPATAIIRVTTLWFAIVLGLAVFPIAERKSNRTT